MDIEKYKTVIKPLLSEKRYYHSICVSKKAKELAEKYGANTDKAETAGILHDIMKDTPQDKQLELMAEYGIILTDVERGAPKLWHAMLGAEYIEKVLGIRDKEILDAIRYHTTGRADMTLLDKILFIADFISSDRDYEGVDKLREAASVSLDEVMVEGITFTVRELLEMRKAIHPDTIAAYNQTVLLNSVK